MKVIPRNQTLLLASEQPGPGMRRGSALDQAVGAASRAGVLTRVTIVSAQPDTSLVYVRADYATVTAEPDAAPATEVAVAVPVPVRLPVRAAGASARGVDTGLSAYLKPIDQYAQVQRIADSGNGSGPSRLDVRA